MKYIKPGRGHRARAPPRPRRTLAGAPAGKDSDVDEESAGPGALNLWWANQIPNRLIDEFIKSLIELLIGIKPGRGRRARAPPRPRQTLEDVPAPVRKADVRLPGKGITLSVETPLCPYGIAYRRFFRCSTSARKVSSSNA